jgi:hypothetical protein
VALASSREGTVSSGSSRISRDDGHVCGVRGMCAPTKRPKLDRSARTHYREALLERWLAQFWNELEYRPFTATSDPKNPRRLSRCSWPNAASSA